MGISVAEKVLRTVFVYLLILLLFRLAGKRGLASLNNFDLGVLFILSNVVQNAVIGNDTSLVGGVIGAVTLVTVNTLFNRWTDVDEHAARLLEGTATTVIRDGKVVTSAMRRLGLRVGEVRDAVRTQTGGSISGVEHGSLEPDGRFLLIEMPSERNATRGDINRLEQRLAAIEDAVRARGNE